MLKVPYRDLILILRGVKIVSVKCKFGTICPNKRGFTAPAGKQEKNRQKGTKYIKTHGLKDAHEQ
jgi:hypothetical protein